MVLRLHGCFASVLGPSAVMTAACRLFPALSLALLAAAATAAHTDVLELGDVDFDYLATEHETMLVKFYAPW